MEEDLKRRKELGAFLKSRRTRFPNDLGIQSAPHRRAKGLRREEVADIAGVSNIWYTWLEQGRAKCSTNGGKTMKYWVSRLDLKGSIIQGLVNLRSSTSRLRFLIAPT